MADAVAELEGTLYQQLPALLQELQANHQNVAHIADWCGQTYVTPGEDKAAIVQAHAELPEGRAAHGGGHMTSAGACSRRRSTCRPSSPRASTRWR